MPTLVHGDLEIDSMRVQISLSRQLKTRKHEFQKNESAGTDWHKHNRYASKEHGVSYF